MKSAWSVGLMAGLMVLGLEARAAGGAEALSFSEAVPAPVKTQMLTDLQVLAGLQGSQSTALFQQIFGGVYSGPTMLGFFTSRIQTVDMDDCGGGGGTMACVIRSVDPNQMYLTENYVSFDLPQVERLSIIIHESRHSEIENDGWPHAKCPVPFLDPNGKDVVGLISGAKMEGAPACDRSGYGAYAVQMEFLKNTELNCQNCSEKVKLDAQIFGDDMVNRIISVQANQLLRRDVGLPIPTSLQKNKP